MAPDAGADVTDATLAWGGAVWVTAWIDEVDSAAVAKPDKPLTQTLSIASRRHAVDGVVGMASAEAVPVRKM